MISFRIPSIHNVWFNLLKRDLSDLDCESVTVYCVKPVVGIVLIIFVIIC